MSCQSLFFSALLCLSVLSPSAHGQFRRNKSSLKTGAHKFQLETAEGQQKSLAINKQDSNVVNVRRDDLLELPMEFLALPTDAIGGKFVDPGERVREQSAKVKLALKIGGKLIKKLTSETEMLQHFVDRVPCLHPETGKQVAFSEYLQFYVARQNYVEAGYFDGSDLEQDPAGLFLRLLLFDKWVLYEAKIIRDGNNWYSLEDCIKGRFKSRYSHLAVDSLKQALQFQGEAKRLPARKLITKSKMYTGALTSYLNTCLFLAEANRATLLKSRLTATSYERIRGAALQARLVLHYRTPLKIVAN